MRIAGVGYQKLREKLLSALRINFIYFNENIVGDSQLNNAVIGVVCAVVENGEDVSFV